MAIRVGTAPDSWGVWFPSDEKQTPWHRCLDEIELAGYEGTELGPFGYLPSGSEALREELGKRELKLMAETIVVDFTDAAAVDEFQRTIDTLARLFEGFPDAEYIAMVTGFYNDEKTGEVSKPKSLSAREWQNFYHNVQRSCDRIRQCGLAPLFHPHADTYIMTEDEIEGLLANTDVGLCLDTGHHVYGGGEPVSFYEKHHERIPFLHVKQCDMDIKDRMDAEGWPFATAVANGVMCEPERGSIDFAAFFGALERHGYDGWVVVEQDMYPVKSYDDPLPIARRTREFIRALGF